MSQLIKRRYQRSIYTSTGLT